MKSISQLTDFYYKELYPTLQELENDRKKIKKRVIYVGIIYLLFVTLIGLAIYKQLSLDILFLFAVFILAGMKFIYSYFVDEYSVDFKNKIIAPLINEIDNNLDYSPHLHIPTAEFNRSKLFSDRPDRVSGNDYVHGKIDDIPILFSDFYAEKKHTNSRNKESWEKIFQGLFIISEFPKNFHAQTIVLPDSAQKFFGNLIGNWLQANNFSRDELVKMDNSEFEKEFVVYSTDQIEARYILTPRLMQKLLSYKKRVKHPLYISFIGGKIYMAIEYNNDMFEPAIFRSLLEYKIAMDYIQTLHLAIGVVEELKLNQKLWSKI